MKFNIKEKLDRINPIKKNADGKRTFFGKKEDGEGKKVLWVLAIIGAVALVIVIAVAVYKYLTPDNVDEFDDEFDDDFDDDFFDDDDEFVEEIVVEDTEE